MSLQCLLVRRRLLCLSQIIRFGNRRLHALLAAKKNDGSRLPWAQQCLSDMLFLHTSCGGKLVELGPPDSNPDGLLFS